MCIQYIFTVSYTRKVSFQSVLYNGSLSFPLFASKEHYPCLPEKDTKDIGSPARDKRLKSRQERAKLEKNDRQISPSHQEGNTDIKKRNIHF